MNKFFLKVHTKDEGSAKKITYYVCFEVASIPVAFKKFDNATSAWTFIHSIQNLDLIPFDMNAMYESMGLVVDECEIIDIDPLENDADTEKKESDTYTPNAVQKRCAKCASYYEPWGMCKVSGGFADSIKACTAFKEIGRR